MVRLHLVTMALVASIAMVSCVDLPPQQIQAAEVKAAAQVKNAELAAKRALEENVLKAEAEGERIRLATLEYETAMRMGDPALAEEVYAHVMAGGSPAYESFLLEASSSTCSSSVCSSDNSFLPEVGYPY